MALESVEIIRRRLEERPGEIEAARKKGLKVAGWQGYILPEEIIYALGFIPVRIGAGGDDRFFEIGSRYVSAKSCAVDSETAGIFADNKDFYIKNTDFLVFDATCLQTPRTAEILKYYFQKNVLLLGVPRNFQWPEAQKYFTRELEYFVEKLEELAGSRLEETKLRRAVSLYNNIRLLIRRIYDYRAERQHLISWNEVHEIINAGYFLDRKEYQALLEGVLQELEAVRGGEIDGKDADEARIFISGSVIPTEAHELINIIQKYGGTIVGDDLWSESIPSLGVHIEEESLEGLASAYLNRTYPDELPYLELNTQKRTVRLKALMQKFQAQGVIYHTLRHCDPYAVKAKEIKDVLVEEGIPLLEIQTEFTRWDYRALSTKVETFVEMIKDRA
ncbi:benzoyl-CoA reductase subunit C [Ruminiclostridium hungatei]|uniref:Benzoyl-CoA reductase subunit C n=1 Tax=Ruminiclostridium hungatei TaxID=48256 RepID=A0A1V4SP21_RUMHU|nr:2-hydroxyacyl-CoA dehydratase family protein [Ruminiclostridium hungatei]OPX44987.1 benzoyl-CoA reductase subunit C [Ruminiclostridium hungatei]